jgi:transcriptional regulator with XRE-family HTH domain
MMKPRQLREAVGISTARAARLAGVSRGTLRLYEASPASIVDDERRGRLDALYRKIRGLAETTQAPAAL